MISLANGKKAKLLDQERTFLNACTMRLFVNDHAPVDADVVANFTECTDGGYAAVNNVGFTPATLNGSNEGQLLAPTKTWVFTFSGGAFTVYGYYFTDNADGALVFADRAAFPFAVGAPGTTYSVTPKKVMDTMEA